MQTRATNRLLLFLIVLSISSAAFNQSLQISDPTQNFNSNLGESQSLFVALDNFVPQDASFLHSWIDGTGYRKLKLGNNPHNYYNPPVDLLAGGNNELLITMRVNDDQSKWNKMFIRPNGVANSIRLIDFVPQDVIVGEWFSFSIPFSEFEGTTDLSQVKNIEFPYSGGANHFDWDIYSIVAKGGGTPYIWMGQGKTGNAHNGNGGPGEVFAEWTIHPHESAHLPEIRILKGSQILASSISFSDHFEFTLDQAGIHDLSIQAWSNGALIAESIISYTVTDSEQSGIGILIDQALEGASFEFDESIWVTSSLSGIDLGPDYLHITAPADGWRKLKIANNPDNLYGPNVDVIGTGNNNLEITIRPKTNDIDWNKIEFRPN